MYAPRLGLNALPSELAPASELCRTQGLALEVTAFAFPSILDTAFDAELERHRAALASVPTLSVHGPYFDLYTTSPDPRIVELARFRHGQGLRAAEELGARVYVAHLNSLPLLRGRAYWKKFNSEFLRFWMPLADQAAAKGLSIALENVWERDPDLHCAILEEADHPSLRASFDNGHALIHSSRPAQAWIEALAGRLIHCHLHDNLRDEDTHQPIGTGQEEWPTLFQALRRFAPEAMLILESDRLSANTRSLAKARRLTSGP